MGNLVRETPYSEITATLEVFDRFNVKREHLTNMRKDEKLARQVADLIVSAHRQGGASKQAVGNVFQITCHGFYTSSVLIKHGEYDWYDDWITNQHFPLETHSSATRWIEFVELDCNPSSEDVLREFQKRGLKRPTAEDALYFGIQHQDEQSKGPIVFLHEPVLLPDGSRRVLGLGGGADYRSLSLNWFDDRWDQYCRFAGVRES